MYLVSVQAKRRRKSAWTVKDSLSELAELARSAGAFVVGSMSQRLDRPTQTYLGKGRIEEMKQIAQERDIDTVICDDELTPTQQRNLENALSDVKVLDRTALILDVFASRARTKEGRLQVEFAQNEYLLPRLAGQWTHLERLGGGIGTRGPGETQIETDRRLVRNRIQRLKKDLEDVRRHRGLYRARRREQQIPIVSIVGYTNAGKSTLLNTLTGAGVLAEDRLFSTLDPVARGVRLPSGREAIFSDTVGFIQNLPTTLIAAFRATLEEIAESTVIIHVVDVTHPNATEQTAAVDEILKELSLSNKPRMLALNKIDILDDEDGADPVESIQEMVEGQPNMIAVSALRGTGIEQLLLKLDELILEHSPDVARASA